MNRHTDVFGSDRSHKTNNEYLFLHQIVALDMNFTATQICFPFPSQETPAMISQFLNFFKRSTGDRSFAAVVTRGCYLDKFGITK